MLLYFSLTSMCKVYLQRVFIRKTGTVFFATSNDVIHKGGVFSKSPSHRENPVDNVMHMFI